MFVYLLAWNNDLPEYIYARFLSKIIAQSLFLESAAAILLLLGCSLVISRRLLLQPMTTSIFLLSSGTLRIELPLI